MTIEISRGNNTFQYRINPLNACCLDRRENKHGARWRHLKRFATSVEAIEALLEIGKTEQERK
jgi:hypothetical protein